MGSKQQTSLMSSLPKDHKFGSIGLCYLLHSCSDQTCRENTPCTTSSITGRQIKSTPLISRLPHSSLLWDIGVQFPLLPDQTWIHIVGDPGECSLCSPFGAVSGAQHQQNQLNLQEGWGDAVGLYTCGSSWVQCRASSTLLLSWWDLKQSYEAFLHVGSQLCWQCGGLLCSWMCKVGAVPCSVVAWGLDWH